MKKEILKVNGLCKTFTLSRRQQKIERTHEKKIRAVDHLSFTAYEGEIFGLLGPNGAGKTTTLRMLATLIRPDEGDAMVDGVSVVKQPDQVRKKIGFLTSELKLEEFFTPSALFDFTVKPNSSYYKKSVKNPYRIKIRFFLLYWSTLRRQLPELPSQVLLTSSGMH